MFECDNFQFGPSQQSKMFSIAPKLTINQIMKTRSKSTAKNPISQGSFEGIVGVAAGPKASV